ncbi:hypothetical protein F5Y17DRAFT_413354 [Xylariaceae sp. FL0594]|nr:hypothetical protein F5Y17DRAFT_413354 [Xylariaceae sp. FL0594]
MSDVTSQRMGDVAPSRRRRRRRPALACLSCRRSKMRCDHRQPCGACVRSRHKTCIYDSTTPRITSNPTPVSSTSGSPGDGLTIPSHATPDNTELGSHSSGGGLVLNLSAMTPVPSSPTTNSRTLLQGTEAGVEKADALFCDVNAVCNRNSQLRQRMDASATFVQDRDNHSVRFQQRQKNQVNREERTTDSYLAVDVHQMSRAVVSKTRYFGQSHWMNSVMHFRPLFELFELQSKDAKSEAVMLMNRCKALARSIKTQRYPSIVTKFGTNIPSKNVADKLVEGYLRTLETVFRVLHVPTFKRDYEKYWKAPSAADSSFTIQLQLVMAIGATLHDDTFTMRKSAVQWVTEAQYWLVGPPGKGKLTMTGLQNMILLTLARETASVSGGLVWVHVGSLLRTALFMGLHRDPSRLPKMSRLDAEMRRRLWNTIMEIELKSSIDSGTYPMAVPDMSDTRAPADVDDVDLLTDEDTVTECDGRGERFTDMTIALLMRDIFPERLEIYQMLNATPSRGTYADTIRLHKRFAAGFKTLTGKIKGYTSSGRQPTSFQCRLVEVMARRCLLGLHSPYLGSGFKDPAYAFSRAQVTETSTRMYLLLFPAAAHGSAVPLLASDGPLDTLSTEGDDLARFVLCAAGFWRLIASQPFMVAALELQMTTHEDQGLGPPLFRPDLLNILRHSLQFHDSRISAGETNTKGYLFATALAGLVQAAIDGLTGQQVLESVNTAAIRTQKLCLEILKRQAAAAGLEASDTPEPGEDLLDWDPLMTADGGWGDATAMRSFFELFSVDAFLGTQDDFDFTV